MSTTGITLDDGDDLSDDSNNSPSEMNTKFSTLVTSIQNALADITDGKRTATNDQGGALAAGDLVYRSSWDATNSRIKVKKAIVTDANATTLYATHVVTTGGADQAVVTVKKIYQLTAQNTNGLTLGRPVYLSTSAGGWTGTLPAANNRIQIVGSILAVSATVGIVEFDLPGAIVPFGSADDV